MTERYSVTSAQADLCMGFLMDQDADGEPYDAPPAIVAAVARYGGWLAAGNQWKAQESVEHLREAIERWLLVDRDACIALLGPGLGLDQ